MPKKKKTELKDKQLIGLYAVLTVSATNGRGVTALAGTVVKIVDARRGFFAIQVAPNFVEASNALQISKIPRAYLRQIGLSFKLPPEEVHVIASTSTGEPGAVMKIPLPPGRETMDGYALHVVRYVRGDVYDALMQKLLDQQAMDDP